MKMRLFYINLIVLIFICNAIIKAQLSLTLESGLVITGYNKVQIPAAAASPFEMGKNLNSTFNLHFRSELEYRFYEKHKLLVLYAPLKTNYEGILPLELYFNNYWFRYGENIKATYRFDSYRLSYAYSFINRPRFELQLGLTAKIRDAEISFDNGTHKEAYFNTGFVALFHVAAKYTINERLNIRLVGDGLAVKFGRAEDFLLSLNYYLNKKLTFYGGYRILEGGSDGGSVYTFALFHYGTFGFIYSF